MTITDRIALDALRVAGVGSLPEIQAWMKKRQEATLRDQFAMQAMLMKLGKPGSAVELPVMAARCYLMADAMLEARSKS